MYLGSIGLRADFVQKKKYYKSLNLEMLLNIRGWVSRCRGERWTRREDRWVCTEERVYGE